MVLNCAIDEMKPSRKELPWWTWILPFFLYHLGTQASLHFQIAPGTAVWYFPIPIGIMLIHWWGPRVLVGLYLNAMLCAGMWGLPKWQFWPFYAMPETLEVFLSWFLFARLAKGRCWLPDIRHTLLFILLGILLPVAIGVFYLQGQFVLLGDITASQFWWLYFSETVADALGILAISVPCLVFFSSIMHRMKLTNLIDDLLQSELIDIHSNRYAAIEITVIFLGSLLVTLLPIGQYWFLFGIFAIWAALRFGFGMTILTNTWIIFLSLFLSSTLHTNLLSDWSQESHLFTIYLGMGVFYFSALITGRSISDLNTEIINRQKADLRLQRNQVTLSQILNSVPQSIFWKDTDSVYLGCNQVFRNDVSMPQTPNIAGLTDYDLPWPKEDADTYRADDREVMDNKRIKRHIIEPLEKADGTRLWVDTTKVPLIDSEGNVYGVLGVYEDITERKEAENALRDSEQKHRSIIELTNDGFWLLDKKGNIVEVNQAYSDMVGYTRDELITMHVSDLDATEKPDDVIRHIQKVIQHGKDRFETLHRTNDGRLLNIEVSTTYSQINGGSFFCFLRDITRQKQYESEILREKLFNESLINSLPGIFYIYDSSLKLVRWNKNHELLTGYSPDELKTMTVSDWLATDEMKKNVMEAIQSVLVEGTATIEVLITIKDGSQHPYLLTGTKIEIDNETLVMGFGIDLRERKEAEEALRISEENLNRAQAVAHIGSWHIDILSDQLTWSPETYRIFGLAPDDPMPEDFFEFVHPDDKEFVDQSWLAALRKEPFDIEHRIIVNDEIRWVREIAALEFSHDGRPLHGLGTVQDITELKAAEEEQKRLLKILNSSLNEIYIFDAETLYFEFVSAGATHNLGFTFKELQTMTPLDIKPEFSKEKFFQLIQPLKTKETNLVAFETIHKRADHSTYPVEVRLQLLTDGIRSIFLAVILDISDRKQAEKEKEKLENLLRQSQKMEAVGQLAGGVAHDFNNLLQVINGYTDMVLENVNPDDPNRESLLEVEKAGNRAATLVSQLLTFSRRQLMKPELLDLNEIIANLLKMLGRVIGEHIRLDFIPGHELGAIHADRGMMEQILMNLCVNARDAMPEGGTLIIETNNVMLDESYSETHPDTPPGHYVMLNVTDTGFGMSGETRAKIFEPFFTTKEQGQGTGLGLSTVYGIARQHGGYVQVYSELGKGTAFKVYFPIRERLNPQAVTKAKGPVPIGNETILIAEDDEMVRKLVKRFLETAGYHIHIAQDGWEALQIYEQYKSEISLLLLDVVMPRIGGREVYDRVRESNPEIKVLFASGYSENAIHTNFVLEEGLELIQKPYNQDDLLRAVRKILDNESD